MALSSISRETLEEHLKPLIRKHPNDTGPQLLWRLQREGILLDPLHDAARVRTLARELKGPLAESAVGLEGAIGKLLQMQSMSAEQPDWVSMMMSLGGGPKGPGGSSIRGRQHCGLA